MMQRRDVLTPTLGTALLSALGLAQAQSTKTVRIVVAFAVGGTGPLGQTRHGATD
jgi:tripartite-type tricarboxylate transporter receptor subunit TctC